MNNSMGNIFVFILFTIGSGIAFDYNLKGLACALGVCAIVMLAVIMTNYIDKG